MSQCNLVCPHGLRCFLPTFPFFTVLYGGEDQLNADDEMFRGFNDFQEELKTFALTGNAVPPVAYLLAVSEIKMIEALSMMMKHFVDMAIEQTTAWKAAQHEIAGGGG